MQVRAVKPRRVSAHDCRIHYRSQVNREILRPLESSPIAAFGPLLALHIVCPWGSLKLQLVRERSRSHWWSPSLAPFCCRCTCYRGHHGSRAELRH